MEAGHRTLCYVKSLIHRYLTVPCSLTNVTFPVSCSVKLCLSATRTSTCNKVSSPLTVYLLLGVLQLPRRGHQQHQPIPGMTIAYSWYGKPTPDSTDLNRTAPRIRYKRSWFIFYLYRTSNIFPTVN